MGSLQHFQNDRGTFFTSRTNTVPAGNAMFFLELSTGFCGRGRAPPVLTSVCCSHRHPRVSSKFVHAFAEAFVLLFRQTTL